MEQRTPPMLLHFFEDFAAQVRVAVSNRQLSDIDARRCLFYTLFYEARCRAKIGGAAQREQAVKLFLQAAELADSASDFDSAMWYYLDTMQMLGLSRYLKALADTAARWKNPAWYADLVQSLRAQLTATKDWKNLETLHTMLAKTQLPEQQAAVAYTLACAGHLPPDRTARLLQEAAGESHDALYYRILGTYRLGGAQLLKDSFNFHSASNGQTQSVRRTQSPAHKRKPVNRTLRPTRAKRKQAHFLPKRRERISTACFISVYTIWSIPALLPCIRRFPLKRHYKSPARWLVKAAMPIRYG